MYLPVPGNNHDFVYSTTVVVVIGVDVAIIS